MVAQLAVGGDSSPPPVSEVDPGEKDVYFSYITLIKICYEQKIKEDL